jgi:hypothetical protein
MVAAEWFTATEGLAILASCIVTCYQRCTTTSVPSYGGNMATGNGQLAILNAMEEQQSPCWGAVLAVH